MKNLWLKLRKTFPSSSSTGLHVGSNPSADWALVLGGFFVGGALIVFFTISIYSALVAENAPDLSGDTSTTTTDVLSSKLIQRVTEFYDGRQVMLDSLLKNPPTLSDPSK